MKEILTVLVRIVDTCFRLLPYELVKQVIVDGLLFRRRVGQNVLMTNVVQTCQRNVYSIQGHTSTFVLYHVQCILIFLSDESQSSICDISVV